MDKVVYRDSSIKKTSTSGVSKNFSSISKNFFVQIVFLGVSVFLLYNVYHSALLTFDKMKIATDANKEVENLRVENLELELQLESMQSVDYLEIQARDRLNFAGENEYVFVIPNDVLDNAKEIIDIELYGDLDKSADPVYVQWIDFFEGGL